MRDALDAADGRLQRLGRAKIRPGELVGDAPIVPLTYAASTTGGWLYLVTLKGTTGARAEPPMPVPRLR